MYAIELGKKQQVSQGDPCDKGLMEFARPSVDRDKKLIYERA